MWRIALRSALRAPGRLVLTALAVAFPVAVLGSTLLFVEHAVQDMTSQSLTPVQVDMRALATSLDVDMSQVRTRLQGVPGVQSVDLYGAADVIVDAPGASTRLSARLIAVDHTYFEHHPWVTAHGDPSSGALLNGGLADAAGFASAKSISLELRGAQRPLGLEIPVAGTADVRLAANTWFAIPAGDVQGDVAVTPRALVVDYQWFAKNLLPELRARYGGPAAVTNPGLSELPPASVENHVTIKRSAIPADPAEASVASSAFRRLLERQAPGEILVADNDVEPLTEAAGDATNAKLIFFLIGIPGALVAAALGLAAASALAAAQRHEDDILRMRGASEGQLGTLIVLQSMVAGLVGIALGLTASVGVVSVAVGTSAWHGISTARLLVILGAALLLGSVNLSARLLALLRVGRGPSGASRATTSASYRPLWLRGRLDVVLVFLGLAILGVNLASGGLRLPLLDTDHQNQTLALAFFVLLAPLALWVGLVLLAIRGWLALLSRRSTPDRARQLTTWPRTAVRWLGRRPGRTMVTLTLGSLAVAFATMVMTFTATYQSAKAADARAAFGSDLRLEPATDRPTPLPQLGPGVASTTPVLYLPARAGSDRKTIAAVDPTTYSTTVTTQPELISGRGAPALAGDPKAVVVSEEIKRDFDLKLGDTLPVTIYPDDLDLTDKLDLHVAGVFRSFPPDDPFSEMVISIHAIQPPVPPADMFLAKTTNDPRVVASRLNGSDLAQAFTAMTLQDAARQRQRSLTALSLGGLSRIEALAGALVAAIGVGLLGAFTILERRREFAVLRMLGASTRQILRPPATEGTLAALGSVVTGIPIGVGLAILAVRVLGLFFTLPPPLVLVPTTSLLVLAAMVLAASGVAIAAVLHRVSRIDIAPLLREP
ncbi:MAG: ABC transporter permease [Marmoricola sp.]